ncbi:MAG: hypothetical protein AAGF25_00415 [Pseudomonadota bacterium]
MTQATTNLLLRASAILWVIWGLVHMLAGVMTISRETGGAIAGIADAVDPALLEMAYHPAAGAVINQHGFNLLWIGATTTIAAYYVWRAVPVAIFIAALVGGLADIGYFIFMDLGGFVNFIPGTLMTLVSSAAVILSFTAYFKSIRHQTNAQSG